MKIILEAFEAHANMDLGLPPAPPMILMADAAARKPLFVAAGFSDLRENVLEIVFPVSNPETTLEFIDKGAVRTRLVYERQTSDAKEEIRKAVIGATNEYLKKGRTAIPSPALLVTATKS